MLDKYDISKSDILSLESCSREQIKKDILALNNKTKEKDLILTEEQVNNLLDVRKYALKDNSLFELDDDVIGNIILVFYGSPYISKIDYDEILYDLVDIYYRLRKMFNYRVTNAYIIELMREKFDGEAKGSTKLVEKYVVNDLFHIKEEKMYLGEDMD